MSALYPFLAPDGDAATDLVRSTEAKAAESLELRLRVLAGLGPALVSCAAAMAAAFRAGGTLFAFGNGGSSTDAQAVAQVFRTPYGSSPGVPAICLTGDAALLTALANDVAFEVVFARQLAALGRPGDVAMALSTSGGSVNVLRGLEQARRTGMVTVGLAGAGGGRMAEEGLADHLFVVPSSSVHRVQEAQTTLCHVLRELAGRARAEA
ncbi:D-sedoheptulose-7-phosphate isomerase [Nonomuraea rhodomycinica]|uniref:SIS domain-containing protein n=1 Tax=Nonomuraea rhodomycinica TaxID=1712872 RepID=A0A7Y6IPF5_9ACTN|nr:SIS domain-containing protein [Nonomuraea rhodomycinica]NUW41999.1 SIS domain-containing protein [Nonomuraea rhodomycinica]